MVVWVNEKSDGRMDGILSEGRESNLSPPPQKGEWEGGRINQNFGRNDNVGNDMGNQIVMYRGFVK